MKLGGKMEKAINNIYSNQTTAIIVNKDLTEKFKVQKRTRQGPFNLIICSCIGGII